MNLCAYVSFLPQALFCVRSLACRLYFAFKQKQRSSFEGFALFFWGFHSLVTMSSSINLVGGRSTKRLGCRARLNNSLTRLQKELGCGSLEQSKLLQRAAGVIKHLQKEFDESHISDAELSPTNSPMDENGMQMELDIQAQALPTDLSVQGQSDMQRTETGSTLLLQYNCQPRVPLDGFYLPSGTAVFLLTTCGIILDCNQDFIQCVDRSSQCQVVGAAWFDLFQRNPVGCKAKHKLRSGQCRYTISDELLTTKSGRCFPARLTLTAKGCVPADGVIFQKELKYAFGVLQQSCTTRQSAFVPALLEIGSLICGQNQCGLPLYKID